MKTSKLIELLNNPQIYEVNKYRPRANKISFFNNQELAIDLNGTWDFEFYPDILSRDEHFMNKEKFENSISVPAHIEMSGFGNIQYVNTQYPWDGVEDVKVGSAPIKTNTCGQYTRNVIIEDIDEYEEFIISFDGVESAFNIWVNGTYVGYSTDTFTTCEFEIKSFLKNGNNKISVEVYKFSASSWLEDQDFWRFSGIFRDVKIKKITRCHIIDFEVKYRVNNEKVTGTINFVKNNNFKVTTNIYKDGVIVATISDLEDTHYFEVKDCELWSPERPELYKFEILTETETFTKKIGFRTIEIQDKVILFNGKRIVFKGINRHEFDAYKGRAIGYEETKKDLMLLKEHNFNAIRCSHYPNNNFFYDLCDEIGFYVIDEVNLETHGTWMVNGVEGENKVDILPNENIKYRDNVLKRAVNLYNRDKNNTSVIMWSLGNESYGGKTLYEMHEYFKDVDSSRLVHYEGVWWDRSYPKTSDVESQMYTRSEVIEEYLNGEFEKPFILCEYTHAMGNSNGNLVDYLKLEDKYDSYQGGFIWEYMDQAIFHEGKFKYGGDFEDRPTDYNFICDGLVGPDREITNELKYVSNLFSPIRITEDKNNFIIKNNNVFKELVNLNIQISKQTQMYNKQIDCISLTLKPQEEYTIEKLNGDEVTLYEVFHDNKLIKQFSEVNVLDIKAESDKKGLECEFVDGDCNFGLHSNRFSILFSKVFNNLISIKYDDKEIIESIESSPRPNMWRAPTNNDVGAGYDKKLSVWSMVSNYQNSQILNYHYENNRLKVLIEFKHKLISEYRVVVEYEINNIGEISIKSKFNAVENMPELFNFGLCLSLNKRYTKYNYLGHGPIESYCDRNTELPKMYNEINIYDQKSYLYPQEFGNRTGVNKLLIYDGDNRGFMIDSSEEFEFALRPYSDKELELKRNRCELNEGAPFLRINHKQAGVAGDDSWGSWCKPEFKLESNKDYEFKINVKPL